MNRAQRMHIHTKHMLTKHIHTKHTLTYLTQLHIYMCNNKTNSPICCWQHARRKRSPKTKPPSRDSKRSKQSLWFRTPSALSWLVARGNGLDVVKFRVGMWKYGLFIWCDWLCYCLVQLYVLLIVVKKAHIICAINLISCHNCGYWRVLVRECNWRILIGLKHNYFWDKNTSGELKSFGQNEFLMWTLQFDWLPWLRLLQASLAMAKLPLPMDELEVAIKVRDAWCQHSDGIHAFILIMSMCMYI